MKILIPLAFAAGAASAAIPQMMNENEPAGPPAATPGAAAAKTTRADQRAVSAWDYGELVRGSFARAGFDVTVEEVRQPTPPPPAGQDYAEQIRASFARAGMAADAGAEDTGADDPALASADGPAR